MNCFPGRGSSCTKLNGFSDLPAPSCLALKHNPMQGYLEGSQLHSMGLTAKSVLSIAVLLWSFCTVSDAFITTKRAALFCLRPYFRFHTCCVLETIALFHPPFKCGAGGGGCSCVAISSLQRFFSFLFCHTTRLFLPVKFVLASSLVPFNWNVKKPEMQQGQALDRDPNRPGNSLS